MKSPAFTVKTEDVTTQVFFLNPGENFPGFGGSKRGLLVGKTASMVIRQYIHESGSMEDLEVDIDSEDHWATLQYLMNKGTIE